MKPFHDWLYEEELQQKITQSQLVALEKFGDRLLEKFGVDIEFTRHFADRMNDERNRPLISIKEMAELFIKIAEKKADRIKKKKDGEVVLHDIQKDLNIPVVLKYNQNKNELEVIHKTVMRKKGFKSKDPFIRYR